MLKNKILEDFFKDITALGGIYLQGIFAIFLLLLGFSSQFWKIVIGFVFIHIILLTIKALYFKPRPKKEKYKSYLEKIIFASSFPSAHAARSTFFAFILSEILISKIQLIIIFSILILIIYSRYYLKKHYPFDLIIGTAIGFITFLIISYIPLSF